MIDDIYKYPKMIKILENIAIILVIVISLLIFLASILHNTRLHTVLTHYIEVNYLLQRMLASILLIIVWNLYKRKRAAWLMTIFLLAISFISYFIHIHSILDYILVTFEAFVLAILIICRNDFRRPTNRISLKRAGILLLIVVVTILLNASLGFFRLHIRMGQRISFLDCIVATCKMLSGMGGASTSNPGWNKYIERFIFGLSWLCIIGCVLLLFKTVICSKKISKDDKRHARDLVMKYGQNPGSYLTLEEDKSYYFGRDVDGVIAYGVVGDIMVVNGDPICAEEDFPSFLSEFKEYCAAHNFHIVFLSITNKFLAIYKMLGFGHVKCGEEARFDIQEYSLKGGKAAKMRANVNHANKAGVTVSEYKPLIQHDSVIEKEFDTISKEWLSMKKGGELAFTVGRVGLDCPMDKRFFYARDVEGRMIGFIVFVPFSFGQGYMADVTRQSKKSVSGVMEKIIYDVFMTFKEEGILWGSAGLAPLANLSSAGERDTPTIKLLSFIYENLNSIYGFKDLRRVKRNYNPSSWEAGYFAFSSKIITPQMAYAVIQIQNTKGVMDYVHSFFQKDNKEIGKHGQSK